MESFLLSLPPETELEICESSIKIIRKFPAKTFQLKSSTSFLPDLLHQLNSGAYREETLLESLKDIDSNCFYYFLHLLNSHGLISYSLEYEDKIAALLEPMVQPLVSINPDLIKTSTFCLSRFAFIRTVNQTLLLESPRGHARLWISNPHLLPLLFSLTKPSKIADFKEHGSLSERWITLLYMAGALTIVSENGKTEEEENIALRQWEFHDLLFHSRSRYGLHNYPTGATFRFEQEIPPLPAIKPSLAAKEIALPQVNEEKFRSDPPFQRVLEERCSERKHATTSLTLEQLSEFLYRCARVKKLFPKEGNTRYPASKRPYPGGGAMYELEIYLAIDNSREVERDLYYYHPLHHTLTPLKVKNADLEKLLHNAKNSAALTAFPNVLITLTARFQRVSWKYSSMAYATILKDVGVLYQNFYLVARAMNLAACGLGCGDASLFAKIANLDYYSESSVGEFMLGRQIETRD